MRPFPWAQAMGFGFGVLRLPADAFWSLTPRELASAMRARAPAVLMPPSRDDLHTLMTRFPDHIRETVDGR